MLASPLVLNLIFMLNTINTSKGVEEEVNLTLPLHDLCCEDWKLRRIVSVK